MTREEIIIKIKKCLELSSSSNEHEAALAMKRAQEMMAKHHITESDIEMSKITESDMQAHDSHKVPVHIVRLANLVVRAFGCGYFFIMQYHNWRNITHVRFIGEGARPEIAAYAFDVLARQMGRGRKAYLAGLSRRLKRANRAKYAALWADGWVRSVSAKVVDMAMSPEERDRIEMAIARRGTEKMTLKGHKLKNEKEFEAFLKGASAGKDVHLHKAVNERRRSMLS
ncbi:MAG: DUF2786 domain-containing protein [Anaerolineae bacterium]|nr:DUF2786 domain-containing protein [Anaerolineae bacterium]